MSKQDLDFGTAANNDGEFLVTGFPKIQANFVRLWTESENVLYVAKQGDDLNDGFTPHEAFKTIQAAILAAETYIGTGDLISPAKIEVRDAGEYTENVTISDGIHLYAPSATLIGKVLMAGQASCVLNRHVWTSGTMLDRTDNDSDKNAYYRANEADMTSGIGGAFCYPTGTGDIFVEVDLIKLNTLSIAFTDETTGSTIYFKVKQCLGDGFGSILVRTDGDASLIWGQCDHYENTGNGYVVYQNSASEIQLFGLEWNALLLYRIEAAGILRFICPNVSGSRSNGGGGTVVEWSIDTIQLKPTLSEIAASDSPYSASNNEIILADTTTGDITIILPDGATDILRIKRSSAGGNSLTLDPAGSDTINGSATITLSANERVDCWLDGTNWLTF